MEPQNLSRRSVARGAAWTIPTIAAAAAAPALAASQCGAPSVSVVGGLNYNYGVLNALPRVGRQLGGATRHERDEAVPRGLDEQLN